MWSLSTRHSGWQSGSRPRALVEALKSWAFWQAQGRRGTAKRHYEALRPRTVAKQLGLPPNPVLMCDDRLISAFLETRLVSSMCGGRASRG